MEIILLKDVKNIGQRGELKNVAEGFARNYLFPYKLATQPSEALKQQFARERNIQKKRILAERADEEALAGVLKKLVITILTKANNDGTLFQGVKAEQIAEKINEATGARLTSIHVKLPKPIKRVGEQLVTIKTNNSTYSITVKIKKQ